MGSNKLVLGLIFVLLLLGIGSYSTNDAFAALDSKGTEFLIAFQENFSGTRGALQLHISGDIATEAKISYPSNSPTFTTTVNVVPGQITTVDLPRTPAVWAPGTPSDNLVKVTSTQEITVYTSNLSRASSDAGLAIPTDTLSFKYIVNMYTSAFSFGQFVVFAANDNTQVTITPSVGLSTGQPANVPFTITLNKGEGFSARTPSTQDLSGSIVTADKPIGLTNGNGCTQVPLGTVACDHIYEHGIPVQGWGTRVLVADLPDRPNGSIYRIYASESNTQLALDGGNIATLGEGQFHETERLSGGHIFSANSPIFVVQYIVGIGASDATNGDPAMANIVPTEQFLNAYTFNTVGQNQFNRHFVTVVAANSDISTIKFDNVAIGASNFSPISTSGFSYAIIDFINQGTHTTSSTNGHGILVGGYNNADSYLYPGGAAFEFINPQPEDDRDGDGVLDINDACPDEFAETVDGCPLSGPLPITEIQCTYDDQPDVELNGILNYTVSGTCDIFRGDDVEMKNMTVNVLKELTQVTSQTVFNDFSSISGLTLNGNAMQSGNVLRVVPSEGGQVGSVYLTDKVGVSQFNSHFQLQFSDPGGFADGLTFIIQDDEDGVNALGGGGGSLGYSGISPSVAASFDIWVNGGCETDRNISIITNGDQCTKLDTADYPFESDQIYDIWIDYDGTTFDVYISTDSNKPATPFVSQNMDIPSMLGTNMAYVGFTAATGGANANHDILNWTFGQGSNTYTQTGDFTITFDDESGVIVVNENGQLSKDGNSISFTGEIQGVDDSEFEPVPQCGDVSADISLINDSIEPQSIRTLVIPSNSATGTISITQCPIVQKTNNGGDNQWNTRPTFGISHEDLATQVVDSGFSFNGEFFTLTDNHHTDFAEQSVEIGTTNSFSAKVYADKKLKVQEFLFGIPEVGKAELAELGVEVWYDRDGSIEDVKVVQKSNVIDASTLSVIHEKSKCLPTDPEPLCDTTTVSMTFLEPLADKVMAIKAIDYALRDQRTFLNEGFDISGDSLNPMSSKMIPSNVRDQGLLKVTQLAKYSPYWQSDDGRMFEMNSFGSFKEINQSFKRHADTGDAKTRLHSGFGGIIQYEQNRALGIFDASQYESELPESFAYIYPESGERITDELLQEMLLQEEIAKGILEQMDKQNRFN